jgi:Tat protein translocase TatB subunit
MFNLGGGEIVVLLLVALLVLGPDKLPDAARTAGKWMREAKSIAGGFQDEMKKAMSDADASKAGSTRPTSTAAPAPDVHPGAGRGPALEPAPEASSSAADDPPGSFL